MQPYPYPYPLPEPYLTLLPNSNSIFHIHTYSFHFKAYLTLLPDSNSIFHIHTSSFHFILYLCFQIPIPSSTSTLPSSSGCGKLVTRAAYMMLKGLSPERKLPGRSGGRRRKGRGQYSGRRRCFHLSNTFPSKVMGL